MPSSMAVVLSVGNSSLLLRHRPAQSPKFCFNKRSSNNLNLAGGGLFLRKGKLSLNNAPSFFNRFGFRFRIGSFQRKDAEYFEAARYTDDPERRDETADSILENEENKTTGIRSSFLAQLAILLGIAASVTLLSICLKQPDQGSFPGIQILAKGASSSTIAVYWFFIQCFWIQSCTSTTYSRMDLFLAADGCWMWTFHQ